MCKDGSVNLMRKSIESTQLEAGAYEPFLFLDYKISGAPMLSHTWMEAIWEHLSLCNGTIKIIDLWLPRPYRVNDVALVSIAEIPNLTDISK
jgi:hypothetical protein